MAKTVGWQEDFLAERATMFEKELHQLRSLLDEVIEDGELTFNEIKSLADWLNQNQKVRSEWPAKQLHRFMKVISADRKISNREAKDLRDLILIIRKQWGAPDITVSKKQCEVDFELYSPYLPKIPLAYDIKSHSRTGVSYHVSLETVSCECPDFRGQRERLEPRHLGRCCKHVFDAFRCVPVKTWPSWLHAFLENSFPPHPNQEWKIFKMRDSPVLLGLPVGDWANAFAPAAEGYSRFGYNVSDHRWAYGIEPEGAEEIASQLEGSRRLQ